MKKLMLAVSLFGLIGSAHALTPAVGYGLHMMGIIGVGAVSAVDGVQACDKEPLRQVHWKGNPGYSFTVAGCDYQAKADKLVVIK